MHQDRLPDSPALAWSLVLENVTRGKSYLADFGDVYRTSEDLFLNEIKLVPVPSLKPKFPSAGVSNFEIASDTQGGATRYTKLIGERDCVIYGEMFARSMRPCVSHACSMTLRCVIFANFN